MENVRLLDCTLRDGGYINQWDFGKENNTEYYRPSYRGRSRYHRDRLSAQLYLG